MFIGEYTHAIDDKGRLSMPAKFRHMLEHGAVVTKGLDSCLFVYTHEEWDRLAKKLASLPLSNAKSRAFARLMLAGAMDVGIDKQGRIVVPEYLRKYAQFGKKVVIAGLFNRIELWDEAAWESYKSATEAESASIAEGLEGLDI
jgi:MraZ protein